MSGFFEELKRRKVYRVAVAYVIAAGGIIQLASAVFPAWELPTWALRLTVVLLLIGFPLALLLAWAFDVTPQGIQATPTLPLNREPELAHRHRRRNITLLVGSGVLVSAVAGFFLLPRADATRMEKSIAVLPFENFSDKPQNTYFADGIQDDILTNLSKIGDLKVISRTSVMGYRGKEKNVRQIGKELGVSAILEGSVRREGDRVRVNVQLINAANDQHIWAEDYDRDLTDVFAIQTDLAQKIAHELQNLFFNYRMKRNFQAANRALDRGLAINPNSFSLRSLKSELAFSERGDLSVAKQALAQFDQAKASGKLKDPNPETVAWVALAKANISLLEGKYPEAIETLQQYSPQLLLAKPHFVEAYLLEGIVREKMGQTAEAGAAFSKAKNDAEAALRETPNDAGRHAALARCLAHLGEKDAAIAEAKRATELLPESVDAFEGPQMTAALAEVYALTGDNAQAIAVFDGLLSRPSDLTVPFLKLDPVLDGLRKDPAFQQMLAKH